MAGCLVFLGEPDRGRIEAAAGRLQFFNEARDIISENGFSAAWVGHDDPRLFGPAFDPATGVRVITSGRVSWDEVDWQRAERLRPFQGGLSNRLLLERYLAGGEAQLDRHNGPAALVVWDPRTQVTHLWTDHFGYHPVFYYRPERCGEVVIGTFPDAIADDPSVSTSLDPVSMAEFLSAWRVTPPHTYYRDITYPGPAVRCTWDQRAQTFERHTYWQPHPSEPFPSLDAAAEELALAVKHAVRVRTLSRVGPVVCYTSGGMDSRAVLFAAASPGNVIGLNLYDVPNKESRVARRLCLAAGVRYLPFARDNDYYPRWLSESTRLSGAMWSHEDSHFLGTRDLVMREGARTVITACTTDWLFKGYGLERTYRKVFGRDIPIRRLTTERLDGFLPNYPRGVPPEVAVAAQERMAACFAGTPRHFTTDADWLAVEDRRVRPACYAVSVSGQSMYRAFPYDTFLADAHVADCYARCKAEWKINSDVWGRAVRRICAAAPRIEDANYGWQVGSSTAGKLVAFGAGWIKRRVAPPPHRPDALATDGSWPNLGWYIRHSATLRNLWESVSPDSRKTVTAAWGTDPWHAPFEEWALAPNDLFRILTLAHYLDQRR